MKLLDVALTVTLIAAFAAPAVAQRPQARDRANDPPADARPPKGMCRIWIDGVPSAQQPAPTDCATAIKSHPAKSRVIFGDDYVDSSKADPRNAKMPPVKGFTDVKPPIVLPKRPPE